MSIDEAAQFIIATVSESLAADGLTSVLTTESAVIGSNSSLDSMKLVELCLALEDKASDLGFEFDWTSENAMSKSRSMFRSVSTLAQEFVGQQSLASPSEAQ